MKTSLRGAAFALLAVLATAISSLPAAAQTAPNWSYGKVPTVAEWNAVFAGKQDYLGAPPLLTTGGTMTGKLVAKASAANAAGFSLQTGVAPSSPLDGDLWITASGLYAQIAGVTVGPYITAGSVSLTIGTTPITGGTSTRILRVNGSVLGEYTITGSGTVVAMATSPTITTPSFTFGTGANSTISASSSNTGFQNQLSARNGGTASTSGTISQVSADLSALANGYVLMGVTGGATPSASLATGAGLTGGFTISAGAGALTITNPTIANITGSTTFSGSVTATGFIPSGSTVLTNGMYLSTTNTLAWSTNSACRIALNATNLFPCTNDQIALGTATLSYADLFLASGGVINWNNGGFTLTHNGSTSLIASGGLQAGQFVPSSSSVAGNSMNLPAANTLGWTINSVQTMTLSSTALGLKDQTALAAGIGGQLNLQGASGSSASYTYAAVKGYATNGTSGSEGGDLQILISQTGSLVSWGRLNGNGRILFAGGGTLAPSSSGTQTLPNGTDTLAGISLAQTLTNKTIDGGSNTITNIANASLVNPSTTVNGQTCTLGSTCTVTAAATSIATGTTTVTGGTTTRVLFNNAGTLGEYAISGSGSVAMTTSPTFVTPTLGAATATSLVTSGGISPGNLANFYLSVSASNGYVNWDALDYDSYDRASNTRQMVIGGVNVWTMTASTVAQTIPLAITSASASALAVGRQGATNPAFQVDASAATQLAGLSVTGAGTGGTVAIAVIDSGANASLSINAKGTGTISIGNVSTGAITLTRATTLSAALTYGGVTLSNSVTGTGSMVLSTNAVLTTPNLGTPSALTLTNATGLPIGGITGLGTNVATGLATATGAVNGFARIIATGTSALGTSAISSGACATVVTTSATGTATTDVIEVGFNGDPTAVTGYVAPNMLSIVPYPSANNVNFKVCNNTAGSITPGAITLNWRVVR